MRPPSVRSLWETPGTQSGKEPKPPISCRSSFGGTLTSTVTFVEDIGDHFLIAQFRAHILYRCKAAAARQTIP